MLEAVQQRIETICRRQRMRHRMATCRATNLSDGNRCHSLGTYDEGRHVHLCEVHRRILDRFPNLVVIR